MSYDDDEDQDALAAEYVLGTLDANERAQAQALIGLDPGFAALVRTWERRLGELNVMVEPAEPPPEVWARIKARIAGGPAAVAAPPQAASPPPSPPVVAAPVAPPVAPAAVPPAAPPVAPVARIEPVSPPMPAATPFPPVAPAAAPPAAPSPLPQFDPSEFFRPSPAATEPAQPQPAPSSSPVAPPMPSAQPPAEPSIDFGPLPKFEPVAPPPPSPPPLAAGVGTPSAEPPPATPASNEFPGLAELVAERQKSQQDTSAQASPERSADVLVLRRRARRWRAFAGLTSAIAACLAGYMVVWTYAPERLPPQIRLPNMVRVQVVEREIRIPPPPAPATPARYVAVLQREPGAPAFLLTMDTHNRTLTVRRVAADREPGKSYELWLVSNRLPGPRSLGVVGGEEFTRRPLAETFTPDVVNSATYAVSLEPEGGSPTGSPTGPVLFTGKLVESLPAQPAATP